MRYDRYRLLRCSRCQVRVYCIPDKLDRKNREQRVRCSRLPPIVAIFRKTVEKRLRVWLGLTRGTAFGPVDGGRCLSNLSPWRQCGARRRALRGLRGCHAYVYEFFRIFHLHLHEVQKVRASTDETTLRDWWRRASVPGINRCSAGASKGSHDDLRVW